MKSIETEEKEIKDVADDYELADGEVFVEKPVLSPEEKEIEERRANINANSD